jgi:FAD/FMN-containing dehydrogenase
VYSLGGAVRDTDADETAFAYRQADYIIAITSSWEHKGEAPRHERWVKAGFDRLYPLTCGSYVNFPYGPTPDYQRAYYGQHLRRLQAVKQKYDPDDIFRFPQSIKLGGS